MKLEEALNYVRENSGNRKFSQSFDLMINLKNIDLKKPENKFSKDIVLPHGRGKDVEVGIISDSIPGAITKNDLETMQGDKHKIKELTKKYEFLICEAPLMALVGKILGRYLAPRGKMPRILPPGTDHKAFVSDVKKSARVKVRDSPVIHVVVGTEKMTNSEVAENVKRIFEEVQKSLPGKVKIKNSYLKLTMGKGVKIDV